jgi:hypothetical protein
MMTQHFLPILRKSVTVWIAILAGIVGWMFIGCGGGGDGFSAVSSAGGGGGGNGDIPPAGNQSPTTTISSPVNTFFNEGENIVFSGTGTDVEDGQVNDGALVWTSSLDGPIGTGSTLVTSSLTPGVHDVTLSATDSNGATDTTEPLPVHVEPTRFLKMGFQTTGVTDASNAFDGDHGTAATITTAETEFIHFKAYIGGVDTFLFRIKLGASLRGSNLVIEGLTPDGNWQPVSNIGLDADKTVTVKVVDAQAYKDADGYINLRALLVNGQSPGTVLIYELWRVDPIYAGSQTIGVDNTELAFDSDLSTPATITDTFTNSGNFLHFKAYVGLGPSNTFAFNVLLNNIGSVHFLVIEVEDIISGNWEFVEYLSLDTDDAKTVSIQDTQNYLDADGYISFRAYWATVIPNYPSGTNVKIFEIWRIDPFIVGPKTTFDGPVVNSENAVDGNPDSFAEIHYFWGELGHDDFLHVQTYVGDVSPISFSVAAAISAPPDAEAIVDGEYEPDKWSAIERISLSDLATATVELPNAREFVNADGYLSLRVRWESDSMNHDAYIYEIRREED